MEPVDGAPMAREEEAEGLEVEEVASVVVYIQIKKLVQMFSTVQASSPIQAAEFVHDLY